MDVSRILLSPPKASRQDVQAVVEALQSGWIAPAGPHIALFEDAISRTVGTEHAVALSSGTAALHLGLKALGIQEDDVVIVPTATFAATAFAVTYLGATPVLVDVDSTWSLDPALLEETARDLQRRGTPAKAVIPVDLFGSPANHDELNSIARRFDMKTLADCAESLGATLQTGAPVAGSGAHASVLSFNGNKIVSTSGGGMLVTNDKDLAEKVRFWATQSREPVHWYEHREIGYNYRLSNVLAALGFSQLQRLEEEVQLRRSVRDRYRELLDVPGVTVQVDPPWGTSNAWLTLVTLDAGVHPQANQRLIFELERCGIEARLPWKPLHLQPVFASAPRYLNGAAERLFKEGICLPSAGSLSDRELVSVCGVVRQVLRS